MREIEIMKREIARKTIHISGLLYLFLLKYLGREITALIVIPLTLSAILFEFARKRKTTVIDNLLRDYEKSRIPGYIYTGLAFSLITPFFSTESCMISAITAFAGDGFAGVAKRVNKSLAIPAFVIPSFLLSILFNLNPVLCMMTTIISSLFDGRKWEDNLTIPISSALTYEVLSNLLI